MNKKIISVNRKAHYDYHIMERFEAGISLLGSEVKSLRAGHIALMEGYIKIENAEAFLYNVNIMAYEHISDMNYDPLRPRKLLLHIREIKKLDEQVRLQKMTIVPLSVYFFRGKAKLELALAKGKKSYDKRAAIKERELKKRIKEFED